MLAALSRRTSRAALVVLGNSLALYNPPIRVAEEMAMLDVISGGRFVAGFPVGSSMDANFAYGQTPATLREKYREAHEPVIRAWTTAEPFTFNGKYTQLRYVNIWPRPIQKPHPPVWIPGSGSVETWEWVARQNYSYSFLSYFGYHPAIHNMQGYWEAVDRIGRDRNPFRAGFLQLVAISDSDARAEAEYSEAASYFYHRCLHVPDHFFAAPGYMTLKSLKAIKTPFSFDTLKKLRWKDFVNEGYIIAGSPATVRERLAHVVRELNVGHLVLLLQFGNLSKEQTLRNTELYPREVMPQLRGLWRDWTDHWYPKPPRPIERAGENGAGGSMNLERISVSFRGGKFRTDVERAGEGPPLVFLHGAGGPMSGAAFLGDLAERFTVCAPAHPGFGPGQGIEHLDDVLDFALYYLDFLDELRLERPHLIGHSFGGMLAAEVAALAPQRLDRLVLVCPAGLWLDQVPIPDFFTFSPEQLVKSALHDPKGSVGKTLLAQFQDPDLALDSYRCLASAGKFLWPIPDKGLQKRIHRVKVPTLVVWGASDRLIPTAYADAFHGAIPGSRVAILNGAGHLPMLEQREAFVDSVVHFLTH